MSGRTGSASATAAEPAATGFFTPGGCDPDPRQQAERPGRGRGDSASTKRYF